MKSQKEAERAEQQRIKNLVLNYDLHESNADQTGTDNHLYLNYFSQPNPNIKIKIKIKPPPYIPAHKTVSQGPGVVEKHGPSHHNATLHQSSSPANANPRPADRTGASRSSQRGRKLQLSDVDWYEQKPGPRLGGRGQGGPHSTAG